MRLASVSELAAQWAGYARSCTGAAGSRRHWVTGSRQAVAPHAQAGAQPVAMPVAAGCGRGSRSVAHGMPSASGAQVNSTGVHTGATPAPPMMLRPGRPTPRESDSESDSDRLHRDRHGTQLGHWPGEGAGGLRLAGFYARTALSARGARSRATGTVQYTEPVITEEGLHLGK
jgi:hypothetical protein